MGSPAETPGQDGGPQVSPCPCQAAVAGSPQATVALACGLHPIPTLAPQSSLWVSGHAGSWRAWVPCPAGPVPRTRRPCSPDGGHCTRVSHLLARSGRQRRSTQREPSKCARRDAGQGRHRGGGRSGRGHSSQRCSPCAYLARTLSGAVGELTVPCAHGTLPGPCPCLLHFCLVEGVPSRGTPHPSSTCRDPVSLRASRELLPMSRRPRSSAPTVKFSPGASERP